MAAIRATYLAVAVKRPRFPSAEAAIANVDTAGVDEFGIASINGATTSTPHKNLASQIGSMPTAGDPTPPSNGL